MLVIFNYNTSYIILSKVKLRMNILWTIIFGVSILFFLFTNPNLLLSTSLESIYASLKLCFTLAGIYIFWMGIIQIMQDSGLASKLSKLLMPIIRFLFGKTDKQTSELIAVNMSANILGLSNASLPAGLKAMERLDEQRRTSGCEQGRDKLTMPMIMLFALNCCSLQFLPSTVILMRTENGSVSSGDIILPIILVSVICFTLTCVLVKTLFKGGANKK